MPAIRGAHHRNGRPPGRGVEGDSTPAAKRINAFGEQRLQEELLAVLRMSATGDAASRCTLVRRGL